MYDQFRNILIEKVIAEYGPDVVKGYTWDTLPTTYPCVGDCMVEHLNYRSRRDISPSDPAVLYLPLGMNNNGAIIILFVQLSQSNGNFRKSHFLLQKVHKSSIWNECSVV